MARLNQKASKGLKVLALSLDEGKLQHLIRCARGVLLVSPIVTAGQAEVHRAPAYLTRATGEGRQLNPATEEFAQAAREGCKRPALRATATASR